MAARGRPRAFDRDDALRRAMEVFWQRGYEGASISDLTAAMGINSPSLYAAFRCKEQLLREAVAHYNEIEGSAAATALCELPTAREAIAEVLRHNVIAFTDPAEATGMHDRADRDHLHRRKPSGAQSSRRMANGTRNAISSNASNAGSPTVTSLPVPTRRRSPRSTTRSTTAWRSRRATAPTGRSCPALPRRPSRRGTGWSARRRDYACRARRSRTSAGVVVRLCAGGPAVRC